MQSDQEVQVCGILWFLWKKYSFIVFYLSFFIIGFFSRGHGNLLILSFSFFFSWTFWVHFLWTSFVHFFFSLSPFFHCHASPFLWNLGEARSRIFMVLSFLRVDGWDFCANFQCRSLALFCGWRVRALESWKHEIFLQKLSQHFDKAQYKNQ